MDTRRSMSLEGCVKRLARLHGAREAVGLVVLGPARVVVESHEAVPTVVPRFRRVRSVHGDLGVVDPQPVAVGVPVREEPALEHLVRGGPDSRDEARGVESSPLHVGKVVLGVSIQNELAYLVERTVPLRPDLRQVERIGPISRRVGERHDLNLHGPGG